MRSTAIVLVGVCLAFGGCANEGAGYYDSWGDFGRPDGGGGGAVDASGHPHDSGVPQGDDAGEDAAAEASGDDGGVDMDSGPQDTGAVCALRFDYGSPQCDTCMSQQCCAQDNTCAGDQNCVALLGCLMQCGPPPPDGGTQCPDMCAQQYMQGMVEFDALGNCLTMSCANPCGGP